MRVRVEIETTELENPDSMSGFTPGVVATCTECDHQTESYGTSGASVRRCLALMRESCPMGEENFYVSDDDED